MLFISRDLSFVLMHTHFLIAAEFAGKSLGYLENSEQDDFEIEIIIKIFDLVCITSILQIPDLVYVVCFLNFSILSFKKIIC